MLERHLKGTGSVQWKKRGVLSGVSVNTGSVKYRTLKIEAGLVLILPSSST